MDVLVRSPSASQHVVPATPTAVYALSVLMNITGCTTAAPGARVLPPASGLTVPHAAGGVLVIMRTETPGAFVFRAALTACSHVCRQYVFSSKVTVTGLPSFCSTSLLGKVGTPVSALTDVSPALDEIISFSPIPMAFAACLLTLKL